MTASQVILTKKIDKSVYFGVRSILASIFGAVIIVLCAFGISALIGNQNILSVVFIALLTVCMVGALFECTLRGLFAMIYQLRLNKRPIGWISLAIFLITFICNGFAERADDSKSNLKICKRAIIVARFI